MELGNLKSLDMYQIPMKEDANSYLFEKKVDVHFLKPKLISFADDFTQPSI